MHRLFKKWNMFIDSQYVQNYTWSSDRPRSKQQTQDLFFLVSQLCSPLCLSSFSDSLFSHGGKRTTTQYKLLLHNSKTTTSNRGPGPDSQSQIGPQAQPWTNQCPGRWTTLIGPGLGHATPGVGDGVTLTKLHGLKAGYRWISSGKMRVHLLERETDAGQANHKYL